MNSDTESTLARRGFLTDLLTTPEVLLARPDEALGRALLRSTSIAVLSLALYGVAIGTFQGGSQILVAALKAPLIVAVSLLLCMPSLLVLACMAGLKASPRRLFLIVSLLAARVALILAAIAPVSWLFSVASTGPITPLLLHLFAWLTALALGREVLRAALPEPRADRISRLWLALLILVSFQVTTLFRPLLWKGPREPSFTWDRKPFLEHLYETLDSPAPLDPADPVTLESTSTK